MKIAIIIPPFISVPVEGQGGTERIAQGMIEELINRGHKVTLIGAGNCVTKANFVQIFKKTISEQKNNPVLTEISRPLRIETAYITKVMKYLSDNNSKFDVVYNHMRGGYLLLPLSEKLNTPIISICHLPLFEEMIDAISQFSRPNIISISNSQRKIAHNRINFLATVYNGADPNEFIFNDKPDDYLLFVGAMGEHKSPHLAIEAAKKAGERLILAGGKIREPYFSEQVKPFIDGDMIQYVGEVRGERRVGLYGKAKAFLFPIKWPEPFGLVLIESMACGTPVIAFDNGAIREIIDDGKDGFIVKDVEQMVNAIGKISQIDRMGCRKKFEQKFTYNRMVNDYILAYEEIKKRDDI